MLAPLCLLMVLGGVAEIAAIAGVLPFLSLLSGEEAEGSITQVFAFLESLGARTHEQQVLLAAVLFMALTALVGAARLLLVLFSQRWAFGTGHDLAVEIERKILSQPYVFHVEHNSSTLLAGLEKVHIVSLEVLLQLVYAATAAIAGFLIVVALVWVDPVSAALAAAGFGSVYLVVSRLAAGRLRRNSEGGARAYDERLKIVQESLGGIRDIIIDDSQQVHLDAFADADRRFVAATGSTIFIGAAPRFVIEAAASVVIALLALLLWQRSGGFPAAVPILGVMALGGFRLLPYLQQLYFSWTVVAGHAAAVSDVMALLRLPVPAEVSAPAPLPLQKGIRFEGVSFHFAGGSRAALDDVSLFIPAGSKVALIGRNGSGKSTFADLAMGLLRPDAGRILVDDTALDDRNRRAWGRSVAHVPQSIFLADTTIARNIAFGVRDDEVDLRRLEAVARTALLDELLSDLPNGLDTRIGERGIRLSGGQRQRLGLARALYKGTRVLVLDEATSALDTEAEAALVRSLFEREAEHTIILISHRGSAIDQCDIVVSLDRGRLVSVDERRSAPGQRAKA